MKANVLAIAALLALPAAAQQQESRGQEVVRAVTLPSGGIVLDFKQIDKNNDRSISVEEWNDFIASLRARTVERGSGGAAATGATGSAREGKR